MPPPRIGSLCSGYGGLDMAVRQVLGGQAVWHADPDPGATAILTHHWPEVPNHGDITAVDWTTAEPVDVLTAGFPCQDVSLAGKRAGIADGTRSGLWRHVARAIHELQPRLVVIENVRGLLSTQAHSDLEPCTWCLGDAGGEPPLRALGAVLGDLAGLGFDAEWASVRASDIGAPHQRERVFAVAWSAGYSYGVARSQGGALAGRSGAVGEPGAVPGTVRPDRVHAPAGTGRHARSEDHAHRAAVARGGRATPTDAQVDGRQQGRPEPARQLGRPDAALGRDVDWGHYAPAIARWEHVIGRPAPAPTEPTGRGGVSRLSPAFVEWMQGLPPGHVTAVPGLARNQQLKALGNGVVPQQGAAALRLLLARVDTALPTA